MLALLLLDAVSTYDLPARKIRVSTNVGSVAGAYTHDMETRTAHSPIPARVIVRTVTGQVCHGSDIVSLSPREQDLLLAIASRERPLATAELADMIYPERDFGDSANLIKVYMFRLRKRLSADFVFWHDGGYAVGPHVRSDLSVARALLERFAHPGVMPSPSERAEALQVARGLRAQPLLRLADFEWYASVAQHAGRVGRQLALTIARRALHDGEVDVCLSVALDLTIEDACDEEAWELLIQAHLMRGEHLAAAQSFRFYERTLAQELDLAPSAHLRDLLDKSAFTARAAHSA